VPNVAIADRHLIEAANGIAKKENAIYLQRRASLSANMCRHTADTHCSLMKRVLSGF